MNEDSRLIPLRNRRKSLELEIEDEEDNPFHADSSSFLELEGQPNNFTDTDPWLKDSPSKDASLNFMDSSPRFALAKADY